MPTPRADRVGATLVLLLVAAAGVSGLLPNGARGPRPPAAAVTTAARTAARAPVGTALSVPRTLPGGGTQVFAGNPVLVAYYGTAGTGALGVLGEDTPDRIVPRLRRAAAPFAQTGRRVQPVFELIVTVAHAHPTRGGLYNSDLPRAAVRRYIAAAHRHGVLLVLDVQPGRADFPSVAKRWAWALRDPWVGLALDPEWRMGPTGVPGRRIGSVRALEVNRVAAWLDHLTAAAGLPQKLLVVHQFRRDMVRGIDNVRQRPHLALVQHVDGFGTQEQKMATFRNVARPDLFHLGFKLFYDEDVHRMGARRVLRVRPRVDFVSFQ